MQIEYIIEKLHQEHYATPDEVCFLLKNYNTRHLELLHRKAREITLQYFGNQVYIRGLIEIGNYCSNDCFYCGIRKSNFHATRYRLTEKEILECCDNGYTLGFRTFVLQGGEEKGNADKIIHTISEIRKRFPDAAITLSLGEKETAVYEEFYKAGANRYLLRHETHNEAHYHMLHPAEMSLSNRLRCLNDLKRIGFQAGTGIMVGSPGQTIAHLIEDIFFIWKLQPEMIGIGPFLPHRQTPFRNAPSGIIEQTLLLISVFRLMHPKALIPSTTALATLAKDGREKGILAGANVVMPNLSPPAQRSKYALYDNKAAMGAEAAEGLYLLQEKLSSIGYIIHMGRGDHPDKTA